MKIIITVNTYYPLKDGVQAVTEYQAEGLAKRGHDVTILTTTNGNAPLKEVYNDVEIIRLNIHTVHAIHRGDKKQYQKFILDITKNADALINVCTQTALTDWVLPILDKINCVKFLYMHGMIDFKWYSKDFYSLKAILHKTWNNSRWFYLYNYLGKYFKNYNYVSQLHCFDRGYCYFQKHYNIKSVILENAADNDFFNYSNDKSIDFKRKYLIYVANYIERKNQKFCLEAFYKSECSNKYEMIFIGSEKTPYYNKLIDYDNELSKIYGKKNVCFLTDIPRNEVYLYVKNASIYLMGSRWEAFPISIIEAMAAGVPYISTNVGCVRFFPGGVIVNNISEMVYWINQLINDENLMYSIGESGRIYALSKFTIESKVTQLEKYLKLEEV